jgi:hypothetical protein
MHEIAVALPELAGLETLSPHRWRPLIIAGMHRSGTSLTAAGLQAAGLNLGERLAGVSLGNEFGHFENLDFLNLHEDILRSQGHSPEGWVANSSVPVPQAFVDRAREIVEKNASQDAWGWKDPRTTLFLDFWAELLPQANFLLLVRSPWEVVDSLFRRGDAIFADNPNHALTVWLAYNQAIYDFYRKFQPRCLLITIDTFIQYPEEILATLNRKFSLSLKSSTVPAFHAEAFNTDASASHRRTMMSEFFPEATQLWQQLSDLSYCVSESLNDTSPPSTFRDWAFRDWFDLRSEQMSVKSTQAEFQTEREELTRAIEEMSSSLSWQITKPFRLLKWLLKTWFDALLECLKH